MLSEHNTAMNSTRRMLAMAAIGVAALPAIALGESRASILMRFSTVASEDSPRGRAARAFKDMVEKSTHGKVHVDIFFDSTLYVQRDELQALQLGAVQVVCANLHTFS